MPAKIGSVCLQELKQNHNGRVIRAGAYAGGRMGAQARAYGSSSQARQLIRPPEWRLGRDCAAGNTKPAG